MPSGYVGGENYLFQWKDAQQFFSLLFAWCGVFAYEKSGFTAREK
jgi:hypothetical protein